MEGMIGVGGPVFDHTGGVIAAFQRGRTCDATLRPAHAGNHALGLLGQRPDFTSPGVQGEIGRSAGRQIGRSAGRQVGGRQIGRSADRQVGRSADGLGGLEGPD